MFPLYVWMSGYNCDEVTIEFAYGSNFFYQDQIYTRTDMNC